MPIFLSFLFHLFISQHPGNTSLFQNPDPCEEAKTGAIAATVFAKDSLFQSALVNIKNVFATDRNEHCISFGKDAAGNIIVSVVSGGGATSGQVPAIANGFADLHNHPNNLPPDAGDFYGLMRLNKNNAGYTKRFVITLNSTVYALLITNIKTALAFIKKNPPQPPAFAGGPQGFPVAITDEAREMKYKYNCTDEMVLAFILEKYNTGVALLKQQSDGSFKKLITSLVKNKNGLTYNIGICY